MIGSLCTVVWIEGWGCSAIHNTFSRADWIYEYHCNSTSGIVIALPELRISSVWGFTALRPHKIHRKAMKHISKYTTVHMKRHITDRFLQRHRVLVFSINDSDTQPWKCFLFCAINGWSVSQISELLGIKINIWDATSLKSTGMVSCRVLTLVVGIEWVS